MDVTTFEQLIREIVTRSLVPGIAGMAVRLVVNPRAGGFSRAGRLEAACELLERELNARKERATAEPESWEVVHTKASRHATELANDMLEQAALRHNQDWLVILACGDGTTWEFLDGLTRAPDEILGRFTLLRLPMGTGNDGTDGWTLSDSVSRLFEDGAVMRQPYISILPAKTSRKLGDLRNGQYRAFNIASIGLDAFVAHMTNKLKKVFPGDSFKLWLDLATVFYDSIYKTGTMKIQGRGSIAERPPQTKVRKYGALAEQKTQETFLLEGKFLLLAVGADGYRTYGSHQLILPDANNVCLVEKMGLFRKIQLKTPIVSGGHKQFPEVVLASALELVVEYDQKILIQMDGESVLLEPDDFPLVIKISPPVIRYLGRKDKRRHT